MNNKLEFCQSVAAAEPNEGYEEALMQNESAEPAIAAMTDFCRFASTVGGNPTLATAKVACERSRDGWLKLFLARRIVLEKHRDLVGDFVQSLLDATDSASEFLHRDQTHMSPSDVADLKHYVDNMKDRVRLLTSLLVGEDRVRRTIVESTSSLV